MSGWLRRLVGGPPAPGPAAPAYLLPNPALDWLRRAHGALAAWVADRTPDGGALEIALAPGRLDVDGPDALVAERRVRDAAEDGRERVERLEGGHLLVRAAHGVAAGLLLPSAAPAVLDEARADLDLLLDGMRRRPRITPFRRGTESAASLESIASVGQRLAILLQRETGADVLVIAFLDGSGRVVGRAGAVDPRLERGELEAAVPDLAGADGASAPVYVEGGLLPTPGDRRASRGTVLVPVRVHDRSIGAVALWIPGQSAPPGPVVARAKELIQNAADRFSRALEHERLREELVRDPLTRLPNRRRLEEVMGDQTVTTGALIALDLDHFKRLNDTLGHAAGDAALRHFSQLLMAQVRAGDTAARVGGEEFVVWLPGTPLGEGLAIAERIRRALAESRFAWQGAPWPLTASVGVASVPETSRSIPNLLAQADAALYAAKGAGRNRVALAPTHE